MESPSFFVCCTRGLKLELSHQSLQLFGYTIKLAGCRCRLVGSPCRLLDNFRNLYHVVADLRCRGGLLFGGSGDLVDLGLQCAYKVLI